jgi:fluoroacetyl-CoA thioesterase
MTLVVGLRNSESIVIGESLAVPAMAHAFGNFSTMPPVFATAYMVAFAEYACLQLADRHLPPEERTVGTHVDLSHLAATPVGMQVTAEVELVSIEGRTLRFKVECRDEMDTICTGFHERAVIDVVKFNQRVLRKSKHNL